MPLQFVDLNCVIKIFCNSFSNKILILCQYTAERRIVGGQNAVPGQIPSQVSLRALGGGVSKIII